MTLSEIKNTLHTLIDEIERIEAEAKERATLSSTSLSTLSTTTKQVQGEVHHLRELNRDFAEALRLLLSQPTKPTIQAVARAILARTTQ